MTKQTELLVVQDIRTVEGLFRYINENGQQLFDVMLQIIKSHDPDFDAQNFADLSYSVIFGLLEHCEQRLKNVRYAIAKDVGANLDLGGICFEGLEELIKEEETNESAE